MVQNRTWRSRAPEDRPLYGLELRPGWLRMPDSVPYNNSRLARLVADAARGLEALHKSGLIHGAIRPESLRLWPREDHLRLEDLPAMPLATLKSDTDSIRDDMAALAAAFAVKITGNAPPERGPGASSIARKIRHGNAGLDPKLALLLGRCMATQPPDRIDRYTDLIAPLYPIIRRDVQLTDLGDRIVAWIYEAFIAVIFLAPMLALAFAASRAADTPLYFTAPLVWLLTIAGLEIWMGSTPGRLVRGLRLVDASAHGRRVGGSCFTCC